MKLVVAMHILCRTKILPVDLNRARYLLQTFVQEFETYYGEENMVLNIHLLLHNVSCVERCGSMFEYSNYCTEDFIGHLISLVRGNTDVLNQICDRYLLEKNLGKQINESSRARSFYNITAYSHFSNTMQLGNFLLIGKRKSFVKNEENAWIFDHCNCPKIDTYRAVFAKSNLYFESASSKKKRTYDSFICIPNHQIYAEINAILVANDDVYMLINNKFKVKNSRFNENPVLIELEETQKRDIKLIRASIVGSKFAFIYVSSTMMTCAAFPNTVERN